MRSGWGGILFGGIFLSVGREFELVKKKIPVKGEKRVSRNVFQGILRRPVLAELAWSDFARATAASSVRRGFANAVGETLLELDADAELAVFHFHSPANVAQPLEQRFHAVAVDDDFDFAIIFETLG